MNQMLTKFFSTILPKISQTEYYHLWNLKQGNIACDSIEGLVRRTLKVYYDINLYFSLCTSKDPAHRRTKDLVSGQALAFDIDLKGSLNHTDSSNYNTQDEAFAALNKFTKGFNLEPTYIIDSGSGGLHVYFALDVPVPALIRTQMQKALADIALNDYDLHIDKQALSPTQVLRVPFSYHQKTGKQATILSDTGIIYNASDLLNDLKELSPKSFETKIYTSDSSDRVPPRDIPVTLSDTPEFGFDTPSCLYPANEVYNVLCRCYQLFAMADNNYKNWFGALGIIGHFINGYQVAKDWSQMGKLGKYDEAAFEKQWDNIILDRPQTCELFKQYRPKLCEICPYNGMISSPITLHDVTDLNTVIPTIKDFYLKKVPTIEDKYSLTKTQVLTLNIPDPLPLTNKINYTPIPANYHLTQTYLTENNPCKTYIVEEKKDKNGFTTQQKKVLFNGKLEFTHYDEFKDGSQLKQTQYHFLASRDNTPAYDIVLTDINNMKQVSTDMTNNGLILGSAGEKVVQQYLSSYTRDVMARKNVPKSVSSEAYGWYTLDTGELGYLTDAGIITAHQLLPASLRTYDLKTNKAENKRFYAQGDLAEWQKAMNVYDILRQKLSKLTICLSFASPLFSQVIPDIRNAMLNLYGGSGIGKSTVLHAAMSVWGNPKLTSIKGSAIAVQKLLGLWNNMPACVEELLVTINNPLQLGSLVFQLIDGSENTKLTQKSQVKSAATWSNVFFSAANMPLKEALLEYANGHNATQMRVIDVSFDVDSYISEQPEYKLIKEGMEKFRLNFGLAGPYFIQWCLQNWNEITNLRFRIEKLIERHSVPSAHRYLTYPLALGILTCDLINRAGILPWNYKELEDYVFTDLYPTLIKDVEETVTSPLDMFKNFIVENLAEHCLIVDHDRLKKNETELIHNAQTPPNYAIVVPRKALYMRWAVRDNILKISLSAFKTWILNRGFSYKEVKIAITKALPTHYFNERVNVKLGAGVIGLLESLESKVLLLNAWDLEALKILGTIQQNIEGIVKPTSDYHTLPPQMVPEGLFVPQGQVYIGKDNHGQHRFRDPTEQEKALLSSFAAWSK